MSVEQNLSARAEHSCELCQSKNSLVVFNVPPHEHPSMDNSIYACQNCVSQINGEVTIDVNHWRCLNDSMWSPVAGVQVMAFTMLNRLSSESWAQDLLDMMYLEEDVRSWAESLLVVENSQQPTLDSNGAPLVSGDTVVLVKDLDVKGGNFTAKRGTAVRNIGLSDNPEHIQGRVNGVQIVILTKYVKKSN
jgi:protein PhnA